MTDIVARLEASLDLPDLPDAARKNARELFENLSRPVIVAVLGPPGSGKSALINLFLRDRLLPEELSANVIEIVPGADFAAEVSYPDGRLEAVERGELAEVKEAEHVHIAASNAVLRDIVLIEASGCGIEANLSAAIEDASKRADIVLWCTQNFGENERALWKHMDQQKKDHAFLLLTKADKMARKRKLAQALAALTGVAQEDFSGLLPIATLQALKALDDDPMDDDLWAGSGADGLIKRIGDHVRYGRQADFDQAELFLARYTNGAEPGVDAPNTAGASQHTSNTPRRRRSRMTREVVAAMRNEAAEASERAEAKLQEAAATQEDVTPNDSAKHKRGEQPVTRPLELELSIEEPKGEAPEIKSRRKDVETVPLNEPLPGDFDDGAPADIVELVQDNDSAEVDDEPLDVVTGEVDAEHPDKTADETPKSPEDESVLETENLVKDETTSEGETVEDTAAPAGKHSTADGLADRLGAMRRIPSKQLLTPDSAAKLGLDAIGKAAVALAEVQEDPQQVLDRCADTAVALQELFDNGALPANLIELRDEVLQTGEHITLLQLENTAGSAANAVTILLQLKRDFEARQAA